MAPSPGSGHTVRLDDQVYRTDVADGPVVLTEEVSGVRSASVGVWVRWGASHEPVERLGISHLLEHMVFKGTRRRSAREVALEIEGIGGTLDAYTAREHTAYFARVLDEHLPVAIDVLSDLVYHPLLQAQDLEMEKNVILEEIASVEDTPEELVFDLHSRALWGEHPYGNPILGVRETVESIDHQDLRDLHRQVYRPSSVIVAAAGNLQHERLLDLIVKAAPGEAAGTSNASVPEPTGLDPSDRRYRRETAQAHLCIGTATFPHSDPRRYGLVLLSTALGGGMSSRLFQKVREELGLAYTVYSYQSFYSRAGQAGIYLATGPETASRALEVVSEELGRLAESGLPADELESVRNQAKGQVMLSLEPTSARMHRLAGVALYGEPYLTLDEVYERIDAVTAEEVAGLCRTYYAPERQTVVGLGPFSGVETAVPGGADGGGARRTESRARENR